MLFNPLIKKEYSQLSFNEKLIERKRKSIKAIAFLKI